jgi:hypothetical protein
MNLAAMLIAANSKPHTERVRTDKKKPKGLKLGEKTPEMKASRKVTMRKARNARWKAAFDQFGGTASTNQIAGVLGYYKCSVGSLLRDMSREEPPLVRKVGEIEKEGRGHNQFVWEWIAK